MVDRPNEKADFYWLLRDGQRLSGSELELRSALSSGVLTGDSLVWRKGWAEWQAARRVPELASSLPTQREADRRSAPRSSKPSAAPVQMPPLVARTPLSLSRPSAHSLRVTVPATPSRLSNRPKAPSAADHEPARDTLAPASTPSALTPAGAPSSFGSIGAPRRAPPVPSSPARAESGPPPPPVRARAPLPTLTEDDGVVSATATLRPPGAVPPPPRGVPVPVLETANFGLERRASLTPVPGFGTAGGARSVPAPALAPRFGAPPSSPSAVSTPVALTPSGNSSGGKPAALPPVIDKALLGKPASASSEPPLVSTLAVLEPVPPDARRTPIDALHAAKPSTAQSSRPAPSSRDSLMQLGPYAVRGRSVVMALAGLCAALLLAVIGLTLSRKSGAIAEPTAPPSAARALPTPAPALPSGCRLAVPAARVYGNVERSVPPYAAKLPGESTLALGFAASKTDGVGLRLNTDTLDVMQAFEEEGKEAVHGVVPLTHSGTLAFFVDRDDSALRSAHTVDEVPPFTLGLSDAGFARVVAGTASLVWPLEANVKITEPRSAQLGAFGYGVTFRRGGQSGSVLLGFVGSDGSKKSELAEIPNAPKLLGTPMIAGSAAGVLVAFAGRASAEQPWQLFVSLGKPGAAPSAARALITGSAGGAISPALSAVGSDSWLVQWTEGSSGQYHVHVQSFSADLSPIGPSVLVSPKGANAGQGSLSAFAGSAASLFILTTAGHDELWGAMLACR